MVLIYVPAHELRVGYCVSSKVGNAVTRNRLRRCFREDFRMLRPSLKEGKYIFVARVSAKDAPRAALASHMRSLLSRAGLMGESPSAKSADSPEQKGGLPDEAQ